MSFSGMGRSALIVVIGVALSVIAYAAWRDSGFVARLDHQTLAWRYQLRGPITPGPDVVVVEIDDATIAEAGGWPIPRAVLATTVRTLSEAGVRAIGLDLLMVSYQGPVISGGPGPGDQTLMAALRDAANCIVAISPLRPADPDMTADDAGRLTEASYMTVFSAAGVVDRAQVRGFVLPALGYDAVARLGHVGVDVASDGGTLRVPLVLRFGEGYVPAMPTELVRFSLGAEPGDVTIVPGMGIRFPGHDVMTDARLGIALNHYGPGRTVPTVSLAEVVNDPSVAAGLADKLVIIGVHATGVGDTLVSPFGGVISGAEVLAVATDNLLTGRALRRDDLATTFDLAAIVALTVAGALVASQLALPLALIAAAVIGAVWFGVITWAFATSALWLNGVMPLLGLIAGFVPQAMLRRPQSPVRKRPTSASPYGADVTRNIAAVLFVDMAGSTAFAQSQPTPEAIERMRRFHRMIERAVRDAGGRVAKYMGDGAMATFDEHTGDEPAPVAGLNAVLALDKAVSDWNRDLASVGLESVGMRAGLHVGPVTVARLGGDDLPDLSPTGDTVNLAARLEQMAKEEGARIALSDAVATAAMGAGHGDLIDGFRELAPREVPGRRGYVSVWVKGDADVRAD